MTDDDPSEAYEVVPIAETRRGPPHGWWTVKRNGVPVRHFPGKEKAERYATDPDYRASLQTKKAPEKAKGSPTRPKLALISMRRLLFANGLRSTTDVGPKALLPICSSKERSMSACGCSWPSPLPFATCTKFILHRSPHYISQPRFV